MIFLLPLALGADGWQAGTPAIMELPGSAHELAVIRQSDEPVLYISGPDGTFRVRADGNAQRVDGEAGRLFVVDLDRNGQADVVRCSERGVEFLGTRYATPISDTPCTAAAQYDAISSAGLAVAGRTGLHGLRFVGEDWKATRFPGTEQEPIIAVAARRRAIAYVTVGGEAFTISPQGKMSLGGSAQGVRSFDGGFAAAAARITHNHGDRWSLGAADKLTIYDWPAEGSHTDLDLGPYQAATSTDLNTDGCPDIVLVVGRTAHWYTGSCQAERRELRLGTGVSRIAVKAGSVAYFEVRSALRKVEEFRLVRGPAGVSLSDGQLRVDAATLDRGTYNLVFRGHGAGSRSLSVELVVQ